MLQAKPGTYIFPPRSSTAVPFDEANYLAEIGWIWQYKVNDTRIMIKYLPDGKIELWNRHGERPRSYRPPDELLEQLRVVAEVLELAPDAYHLLDGGLLDQKTRTIKDTIVIWDILVRDGVHLLGTKYKDRFAQIARGTVPCKYSHDLPSPVQLGLCFSTKAPSVFHLERNPCDSPEAAWEVGKRVNAPLPPGSMVLEGLVFKDEDGCLEMGLREKNNGSWQCRCRFSSGRHLF